MSWQTFEGEYKKERYDVLTPDGKIYTLCWPHAGLLYEMSGAGLTWGKGEAQFRPTLFRGEVSNTFERRAYQAFCEKEG